MNTQNLRENASSTVDLDALPSVLEKATVTDVIEKLDKNKRQAVFVVMNYEGQEFSQKFTTGHWEKLADALDALQIKDTVELKGRNFKFVRTKFDTGNTRFLPTAEVQ